MKNRLTIAAMAVLLLAGCAEEAPVRGVPPNPLLAVDRSQIQQLRLVGTSSAIPGLHFETTDSAMIDETFNRARALTQDDKPFITMPGNITMVQFLGAEEAVLVEISIGGDGRSIVLHGPESNAAKTLVVQSREYALYCFDLLEKHAPHILREMLTVDDRGTRELHLKSFPFDRIKAAATGSGE